MRAFTRTFVMAGLVLGLGMSILPRVGFCQDSCGGKKKPAKAGDYICAKGRWKMVKMKDDNTAVTGAGKTYKKSETGEWSFCKDCSAISGRPVGKSGGEASGVTEEKEKGAGTAGKAQ